MPKTAQDKPAKPYPDFPLFAHATGRWAKKIRGKFHYFGSWDNPDLALEKYLKEKDYLQAGRKPSENLDGETVRSLCNRYMTVKQQLFDAGEITERTFESYHATCKTVLSAFGKERLVEDLYPEDFGELRASLAKKLSPSSLGNSINRIRMIFKFAYDQGVIDRPIRYGQSFNKPSRKVLRVERNSKDARMFEAAELRTILQAAPQPMKAMILLGINCGFGQTDLSNMPQRIIDFETGWIDYPRIKTGVQRRCHLWTETVEALQEVIEVRPKPKQEDNADLCFITKYGLRWVKKNDDAIAKQFAKLLAKVDLKRHGLNFYALRHTFETIGGESRDQVAVNHIMGHADNSMAAVYRERISDERLKAVTDYVHKWLFGDNKSLSPPN